MHAWLTADAQSATNFCCAQCGSDTRASNGMLSIAHRQAWKRSTSTAERRSASTRASRRTYAASPIVSSSSAASNGCSRAGAGNPRAMAPSGALIERVSSSWTEESQTYV